MADIWYPLFFGCPRCGKQITILTIAVNIHGLVLVDGVCVLCGKEVAIKITYAEMLKEAIESDVLMAMMGG